MACAALMPLNLLAPPASTAMKGLLSAQSGHIAGENFLARYSFPNKLIINMPMELFASKAKQR